jgi:hypothetical protein
MAARSTAENQDRRERIRNQMREFYNVESPARSKSEARSTSAARSQGAVVDADPMNLDSPAFSVERYTTQLLQQQTLKGLVEKDTELRRHVRALDGELQELVYRNYSKFISATDTIRQMKDNVTEMDAKLRALSSNVETIERVSTVISTNLQVHRERIETTLGRNRNLRKVQFLVELADGMQSFMESKRYSLAVRFWCAGDKVLTRHTHISSFEQTHLECRELARRLYALLEDVVRTTPLDSPENVDQVRQAVLDLRKLRETSLFTLLPPGADAAFDNGLVDVMMASATQALRAAVNDTKSSIGRQFTLPAAMGIELCGEREKFLQNVQLRESLNSLKTACAMYTNSWQNLLTIISGGGGALDEKDLNRRITATIQPLLVELAEFIAGAVGDLSLACIRSVIACAGAVPADVVKEISFSVLAAFARLVKQLTSSLKTLGANHLDTDHVRQSHQFEILVDEFARSAFVSVLRLCEEYSEAMPPAAATGAERQAFPRQVLLAALTARTVSRVTMLDMPNSGGFDANPLRGAFSDTCRALVHRFIMLSGQLQSNLVRTALEAGNWHSKSEPIGPSGYAAALVDEWSAVHAVAREWFPAELAVRHERVGSQAESARSNGSSDASGRAESSHHSSRTSSYALTAGFSRRDAAHTIDRMLSTKVAQPLNCSPATCDAPHISEAVILFVLKSFLQYVRYASFNKGGFQQLQVDLSYLLRAFASHSGVWFKREELRAVHLVNEIAANAFERTLEKTPLIADAVEVLAKK